MTIGLISSLACRLLTILCNFATIPVLLGMLTPRIYGVWVTLTSTIAWFLVFDFGLGYAIKNRVAEATTAERSESEVLPLVAGAVQYYGLVALVLLAGVVTAIFFVRPFSEHKLESLLLYVPVLLFLPLAISGAILQGRGRFVAFSLINLILPSAWLIYVMVSKVFGLSFSLTSASVGYALFLTCQTFTLSFIAFKGFMPLSLLLDRSNFRKADSVARAGMRFFALQISSIILFSAGNFVSYQELKAEDVAVFDTVNKVFMFFSTMFNIVITVVWTEVSKAKAVGAVARKKTLYRWLLMGSAGVGVVAVATALEIHPILQLVTHNRLSAGFGDVWPFALLLTVQCAAYSGAVFLNAYERIGGQILFSLIAIPMFVALSSFLFSRHIGLATVPLSSAIAILPSTIYCIAMGYSVAREP